MATSIFPLQNAIKQILDNPNSRPTLPNKSLTTDEISTGGGQTVGGSFGDPDEYGKGSAPDIDMNSRNVVVQVHEALTEGTLDYKVGRVKGKTVDWSKRQKYGEGIQPTVAVNDDGLVIEAHEANQTLRYRVGSIDGNKINFSKSHKYDDGERPSIALNNNWAVVEVHKSQNHDQLYYRVGNINGNTINFSESHNYDSGIRPSVAINDSGLVVEVHQSENHRTLWYRVGKIEGAKIAWRNDGESVEYDKGKRPSVALTSDGHVVVANQRSDDLWYRVGVVDGDSIDWLGESRQYNKHGVTPAVASNDSTLVEVHGSKSSDELTASVLTLPVSEPKWTKREGQYSFLFFQMEVDDPSDERVVTKETITVKPGAPYLLANLTKGTDSAEFPNGAKLSIAGPNGIVYDAQTPSTDKSDVITSGSSLRSLILKEPAAGNYTVSLTVPTSVAFSFSFLTLPYRNVSQALTSSKSALVQNKQLKGSGSGAGGNQQAIEFIAGAWMTFRLTQQRNLRLIDEIVYYGTDSGLSLRNPAHPANVAEAVNTINQHIQIRNNFDQMIQPPDNVTTAPIAGPVREYVRNGDGALQWLHAEVRREHIGTGTEANDAMRDFVNRLSGLRTDDAGHVVGRLLGGTGTHTWNIVPQHRNFNRGAYRNVETVIADAARRYGSVRVWYVFHYDNLLLPNRPTRFDIFYRFPDGTEHIGDLYNPEFVPRGA